MSHHQQQTDLTPGKASCRATFTHFRECCVILVTAAFSARQLLQAGPGETTAFPGCTFLRDSEIATNPDFSILYYNLQYTGLNNTLSSLHSVVTLFAPTNEAFLQYDAANNETEIQAMTEPPRGGEAAAFLADGLQLHVANESLTVTLLYTTYGQSAHSCAPV